jgi:hypothetical protein
MLAGMDRAASSSSGTPSGDTVIASVPQALPRAHAAVLTVRRLDERVRVGDTVTRVSGDAALDSNGELAAIRVTAETVAPPSGSPWSGAER